MKKISCIAIIMIIMISLFCVNISAVNTGFSTKQLSNKETGEIISRINLSRFEEEVVKGSIVCFDVSENGKVAIGERNNNNEYIMIYSNKGDFECGFSFSCMGDFGVEWDSENINLYLVRSDLLISFDLNGKVLGVLEVENTIENNSYRNHSIKSTEHTVNGTKYRIQNDMGILNLVATSYSQVVTIDANGNEAIIYDVNSEQLTKTIFILIAVFVFVVIAVMGVAMEFKKPKRK